MKRLIVNADDFGLCRGVNLGIVHGYVRGIVTSATLMVNMPGAAEAFALARENPGLGVGLHITLTSGRPVARRVSSLTGPHGHFLRLPQLIERARPDELYREVEAQVQAFLASGLHPTHLDGHHHVHRYIPAAAEAMRSVAETLGIPIRQFGAGFSDAFYGKGAIGPDQLLAILDQLPEGLCELMCHPGYVDPDLLQLSTYTMERVGELATLTDSRVRASIIARGITLLNYRGENRMMEHV